MKSVAKGKSGLETSLEQKLNQVNQAFIYYS